MTATSDAVFRAQLTPPVLALGDALNAVCRVLVANGKTRKEAATIVRTIINDHEVWND